MLPFTHPDIVRIAIERQLAPVVDAVHAERAAA